MVDTLHWAKNFLHRMGYVKRRTNTTVRVSVLEFERPDINAIEEIPPDIILNWDHTGLITCLLVTGLWLRKARHRSFPALKYRHRYRIVKIATCKYRHLWKARARLGPRARVRTKDKGLENRLL